MTGPAAVRSVAVIGAGAMGGPMARRLHEAGLRVTVCDRDPDVRTAFAELGVATETAAAGCAAADLVLVLVATPDQVRAVVTGPDGLLPAMDPARPLLVAVMSTVPAELVEQLYDELAGHGVALLDAPVSGGVLRAADGTLTIMVGGDAAALDRARPVFAHLATELFPCGGIGAGETVKLVNNIIGTTAALVTAEACRVAVEKGLDMDLVVRVLDASSGRSWLTSDAGELRTFFDTVTRDRGDFDALMGIVRKDLHLAGDLTDGLDGRYPLVGRLREFADSIGDETFENWRTVGVGGDAS